DGALAEAATEALGRIGRAALPAVLAGTGGTHEERLHAWAALGLMRGERPYRALGRGLEGDPHLVDVIAGALARQGRREAIDALHARTASTPSGSRRAIEAAIFALVRG